MCFDGPGCIVGALDFIADQSRSCNLQHGNVRCCEGNHTEGDLVEGFYLCALLSILTTLSPRLMNSPGNEVVVVKWASFVLPYFVATLIMTTDTNLQCRTGS